LTKYIEARRPILYLVYFDAPGLKEVFQDTATDLDLRHVSWYTRVRTSAPSFSQVSLSAFLQAFESGAPEPSLVVLEDVQQDLEDPLVVAQLKAIASQGVYSDAPTLSNPIIIVAPTLVVPAPLEHLITVVQVPPPTPEDIKGQLQAFAEENDARIGDEVLRDLVESLRGLHQVEIKQILNLVFVETHFGPKAGEVVLREKQQVVTKSGMLEFVSYGPDDTRLGGLGKLQAWLKDKAYIFQHLDEATKASVAVPRGYLLVGMPGCGKSLAAKKTAAEFRLPLLRLDVGKLLGSYVGQSEENMRRALQLAEAVSPCVLWIDEIEKAFAGLNSPSDQTTRRLFGYLLTWMQERKRPVFMVATANAINDLPPEFLRRGRFDELFSVDLPTAAEQAEILRVHLEKRKKPVQGLDLLALSKLKQGFSGADLEAIVETAIERAFRSQSALTTDLLRSVVSDTRPMGEAMGEQLKEYRDLVKKFNIKNAT
jgi:hypothetical protein